METPLLVQLPKELESFYEEHGYLPSTAFENRSNARLRVRSEGKLEFLCLPHAASRARQAAGRVLIKDLSRTGIGILYHEQIFPEEKFRITFQQRQIDVLSVRCRRLSSACYEIGGEVLSTHILTDVEENE
jgi:hypothetical protein